MLLEPIFEVGFCEGSYGFRPGRGCHDASCGCARGATCGCARGATREVDRLLKEGFTFVVDADLQAYFDTIPHDKLMARVEEKISDGRVLGGLARMA